MSVVNASLAEQVQTNLNYFHLWTDISRIEIAASTGEIIFILVGTPPNKIHPDDEPKRQEYVLPSSTESNWTIRQWDEVFDGLDKHRSVKVSRVTMGMVTNDGTIVYYLVNRGLTKPRKN